MLKPFYRRVQPTAKCKLAACMLYVSVFITDRFTVVSDIILMLFFICSAKTAHIVYTDRYTHKHHVKILECTKSEM